MEARGTPSNEDRSAGIGVRIYDNPMYSEQWGEMMAQLRIAQERLNENGGNGTMADRYLFDSP